MNLKKTLIGAIDLEDLLECEDSAVVEYIRTEMEDADDGYDHEVPFGIEVVKKQTINGLIYKEVKTVKGITDNKESADKLLRLLCRNNVTPISVSDILEDLNLLKRRVVLSLD